MTIFGISVAILVYWRPFCFFGNHPNHYYILVIGSLTYLCHVLSRLGLLDPIQRQKHHQNDHFWPIGGHFGFWQPSCFFGNHPNHHYILFIGSLTYLCHVLSRLGLLSSIQKPKHHQNDHFWPIGGHFGFWQPSCFFGNHPNHHYILFIGSLTYLCHVLSRLGLLSSIQKPKHHQNVHFWPIGGHFGFWRPSCLLKIIQIIISSYLLGSMACLHDVLSKQGLLGPIQKPKHHLERDFGLSAAILNPGGHLVFLKNIKISRGCYFFCKATCLCEVSDKSGMYNSSYKLKRPQIDFFYSFHSPLLEANIQGNLSSKIGLTLLHSMYNISATVSPRDFIFFALDSKQKNLKDGVSQNALVIIFLNGLDTLVQLTCI